MFLRIGQGRNVTQAIRGKNVLITGTAQGIGRVMAIRFAGEGARVTGLDLDAGRNAETGRLAGEGFIAFSGDVASAKDVASVVEQCGPVDILINNAATVSGDGLLHQVTEETWNRVSEVCLKSVFLCTRAVLPGMMKRRGGVIISMSSVNALTGIHLAAYTAAKGGILSLTRLLAQQYGAYGIRANAICPGTINTETSQAAYAAALQLRDELRDVSRRKIRRARGYCGMRPVAIGRRLPVRQRDGHCGGRRNVGGTPPPIGS